MRYRGLVLLGCLAGLGLLSAGTAHASDWTEIFSLSGYLSSDIRYTVENHRGANPDDGYRFQANRNDLDFQLRAVPHPNVMAFVDLRLRYWGFNEAATLPELIGRDKIDPFELQLNEAYIHVRDIFWEGFDLRVGRIVQSWGRADIFNPTDNLNPRDLSDPIDYAAKVPNQMIELSLYPSDWLTLTAVWIPVFKPSQLPASAVLGFQVSRDRHGCFLDAPAPPLNRRDTNKLKEEFEKRDRCLLNFADPTVRSVNPETTLANSELALKAAFKFGSFDFSLSYFYGRFTFPIALDAGAFISTSRDSRLIDVKYIAEIYYPRMHVIGGDFSYSADWLAGIGILGEMAVIYPEKTVFGLVIYQQDNESQPTLIHRMKAVNVPASPFIKGTLGLDYTFGAWVYANVMYVRGTFDEFNDRYGIHNYAVAAIESKVKDDAVRFRLASSISLDDHSAMLMPNITLVPYPSLELFVGMMYYLGDTRPSDPLDYAARSKFGQKATGRSVAWLKAKVTW